MTPDLIQDARQKFADIEDPDLFEDKVCEYILTQSQPLFGQARDRIATYPFLVHGYTHGRALATLFHSDPELIYVGVETYKRRKWTFNGFQFYIFTPLAREGQIDIKFPEHLANENPSAHKHLWDWVDMRNKDA